jgi:acetoin utilization protein AcuB
MTARCPHCGKPLPAGVPAWVRDLTVRDVMTTDTITMAPEDSLMRAVELMRAHNIRRIPVVVADTLVGLLAEGDLKRAQPSALTSSQEDFNSVMESTPVSRIMIQNPLSLTADLPLIEAARTLHSMKYGGVPVVDGRRLVGILTDIDLIACLVELISHGG